MLCYNRGQGSGGVGWDVGLVINCTYEFFFITKNYNRKSGWIKLAISRTAGLCLSARVDVNCSLSNE